MNAAAANSRPDAALLSDMVACAHAFGMAFADKAQASDDEARELEYFELFDRCFRAMRIGIALKLKLGQPLAAAMAMPIRGDRERDDERDDLRDRDTADSDRDRETETASFPALIQTLGAVERAATDMGERLPAALRTATLPSLREILDRAKAAPVEAPANRRASLLAAGSSGLTRGSGLALKIRPPPTAAPRGPPPSRRRPP